MDKELGSQQPAERIAKMLEHGDRVRLWRDCRFLDKDCISQEWVVMDSHGNHGLGHCLYSGPDLSKALDVLEEKP